MIPPLFGKQEAGIWRVQKRFPQYGVPIWSLWPNIRFLPSIVAEKNAPKNIKFICTHRETGQKTLPKARFYLYPRSTGGGVYCFTSVRPSVRPKIFFGDSCLEKCDEKCAYMLNVYKNQQRRQTGSRNLTGSKTLPTIWYTYSRDLIFGHKLHIGTPYRGKRFWTRQIPTSCLPS
jgi:hypothetical protein